MSLLFLFSAMLILSSCCSSSFVPQQQSLFLLIPATTVANAWSFTQHYSTLKTKTSTKTKTALWHGGGRGAGRGAGGSAGRHLLKASDCLWTVRAGALDSSRRLSSTTSSSSSTSTCLAASVADETVTNEALVQDKEEQTEGSLATVNPSKSDSENATTESATVSSTTSTTASSTRILVDDPVFRKPDRDMRQYRIVQLPNNLMVLLISDATATGEVGVEAAAVHVQAGHFDDTIAGLAHFHEHMLFLGTQKYPQEEEYEGFLSQFGGFSNAYTDMEDTNYFLSVTTENVGPADTTPALHGALDRMAQFFIAPTFVPDAVERECKAIDSEYRNAKTSDAWRYYQLLKHVCDPRHPFSKFGCGNYDTLLSQGREYLLQELRRFWEQYYQTYNLRLAVAGHASLDALQKTVEETFGQLPYSQGQPRRLASLPNQLFVREHAVYGKGNSDENENEIIKAFGPQQLGVIRRIIPFTEQRSVKIHFATPPLDDPMLQTSKPYRVVSHILGHEAPGSLHALLNAQGYLTGLSSGVSIDTSDFSLFSITVSLTPNGMQHYEQVLNFVFQWIALLQKQPADHLAAYHEELRQMNHVNFQFRENGDPTDFCSSAAELLFDADMVLETPASFLEGSSATEHYNHTAARAFLDRLVPENCMISIVSSDHLAEDDNDAVVNTTGSSEWMTEPWYGAQYQVHPITAEHIKSWQHPGAVDSRLHMPGLNQYIPTDFSLRCDDEDADVDKNTAGEESVVMKDSTEVPPELLLDRPNLRLWHKMDRYWRIPKTFVRLALLSPSVYRTPRSMTYNRIFQRVLNDDLNSFVYDASLAGCNYRVSCVPNGYRISVRGYSEKLPFLLDTLTTRILSLLGEMKNGDALARERFVKAQDSLLRETKNYRLDPPYEVASYNSRLLIEESVWYLDNYVNEMEGEEAALHPLTMEECAKVAQESLMGRIKAEVLCMGNINKEGALEVSRVIDRHFLEPSRTLSEVETPRFRSLKLPTKEEAIRIFGTDAIAAAEMETRTIPLIYQDLAYSETEENNAVEIVLQAGCELDLGYSGLAILDLITHIAYNSAYNQLRTKEQLGYIVSTSARKTAGSTWGMSITVQSSVALPDVLEERCEVWLAAFRQELELMSPESIAQEASAVVAQLLESDTKLSQEVGRYWGEILNTEGLTGRLRTPAFDRLQLLTEELTVKSEEENDDDAEKEGSADAAEKQDDDDDMQTAQELKDRVLNFFDTYLAADAPERRALSARVYSHSSKAEYEAMLDKPGVLSSFADMRHLKQYLSSWPTVPYWRIETPKERNSKQ